jgi:hypothetical protein
VDGQSVVFVLCRFVDEIIDCRAYLMVGALSFVGWDVLFVPIDETAQAATFALVGFSFALVVLALASAFALALRTPSAFASLPDVVGVAASRFDFCR